jgi:hypothetical protein
VQQPLVAPYQPNVGCVLPLSAQELTLTTTELTLALKKNATHAEEKRVQIELQISGTNWENATRWPNAYFWQVAALPDWIQVEPDRRNGTIAAPSDLSAHDTSIPLPLTVLSAPLRDKAEPHESFVRVDVQADFGASMLTLPVYITVTAAPYVSECTVDTEQAVVTVGKAAAFTLTSRDLNGLPLDHVVDGFAMETISGPQDVEGLVEYRGAGGNYSVTLAAPLAGEYVVRVTFDGEPLPQNVSVVAACPANEVANTTDGICKCDAGFEPRADTDQCRPCEVGFFKQTASDTSCLPCTGFGPHRTTESSGANASSACVCDVGYYRDLGADDECLDCLDGASCRRGVTLATLQIAPNSWRLSANSDDLQRCNDDESLFTACTGGEGGGDSICAAHHRGPLCRVCEEVHHFDTARGRCTACPAAADSLAARVLLPLGGIVITVALLVVAAIYSARRNMLPAGAESLWRRVEMLWRRLCSMSTQLGLMGHFKATTDRTFTHLFCLACH